MSRKFYQKRGLTALLVVFLVFSNIFILNGIQVRGEEMDIGDFSGPSVSVNDQGTISSIWSGIVKEVANWGQSFANRAADFAWNNAASNAAWAVLRSTLNNLAYDTATWIGSGGRGQTKLFMSEGWGEYMTNVADNAVGTFVEGMSQSWGYDICRPNVDVQFQIGLGLAQYGRNRANCSFQEMKDNWESALNNENFLTDFQNMFQPESNDFGIAMSMQTKLYSRLQYDSEMAAEKRRETGGWLNVENLAGRSVTPPGAAQQRIAEQQGYYAASMARSSEDPFVDATNIFLNQLAITLFRKMMMNIGKDDTPYTSPYSGDYGGYSLSNYSGSASNGGLAAVQEKMRKLTEPRFDTRADYNILGDLTSCPNPDKAGVSNCVISDKFRQGIEQKMMVLEAVQSGYLDADTIFGYNTDGHEPDYNAGLPYRSLVILRKFRIIPTNWELAAQYIKSHPAVGVKNLGDLLACYDSEVASDAWCRGLIDPSWVLKAPQNYCKRLGYGPEILVRTVVGAGPSSKEVVGRNNNYCADEQSCIKESANGSCDFYGYCTKEKRKWDFAGDSCEANFNTCQTYRAVDGQTASYLANTLDFSTCTTDSTGCEAYCTDYDYEDKKFCSAGAGNKLYFDKSAEECDADEEGCHEFLRPKTGNTLVYQKLIPTYLEGVCYIGAATGDYRLKAVYPAICDNYTRKCLATENGCELYTAMNDVLTVPAQVSSTDYCHENCVGYDQFLQSATFSEVASTQYLIPANASQCSAETVGCDEFTNLDMIGSTTQREAINKYGAENKEYYSYLRQCVKPTDSGCADFYTWEGSGESGYQLKIHKLKGNAAGTEPVTTTNDSAQCNLVIYRLPATDPGYNADCREFYDRNGHITYHLYERTISCSDNCHPFRKTIVVDELTDNCQGGDTSSGACIYNAIPTEGRKCSLNAVGCREYKGAQGADINVLSASDFEGDYDGWQANSGATIALDSESLYVGGESLRVANGVHRTVRLKFDPQKKYLLKLLGKAISGSPTFSGVYLADTDNHRVDFTINTSQLANNWLMYEFSLNAVPRELLSVNEVVLNIAASGGFYLDAVRLIEASDRYYLIQDSWTIPLECLRDMAGNEVGPNYNIGCAAYTDRAGKTHNLRQFTSLCQESAVGCEALVDTKNSNDSADDQNIYAVYDEYKSCSADSKGCQFVGREVRYDGDSVYKGVYLLNDPNKYGDIVCAANQVGCNEWKQESAITRFKNPGFETCEWRKGGAQMKFDWFRTKVKRCDANSDAIVSPNDDFCLVNSDCAKVATASSTCSRDADCGANNKCSAGTCFHSCLDDKTDVACDTDALKTFGMGGLGGAVEQPSSWAGRCAADQNSCTEYIDPLSKFSTNLIFNPRLTDDVDRNNVADGWSNSQQSLKLDGNTLYVFAVENDMSATLTPLGNTRLLELNGNNDLEEIDSSVSLSASANTRVSRRIFVLAGASTAVSVALTSGNQPSNHNSKLIELKKAIISYEIADGVDKSVCATVNEQDSCVAFNERNIEGSGYKALTSDADTDTAIDNENDANVILKVGPDRDCGEWLACKTFGKDSEGKNVCYDIGVCDKMNDNGTCDHFNTVITETEQVYSLDTGVKPIDFSGYVKQGISTSSTDFYRGFYSYGLMEQLGGRLMIGNGDFEFAGLTKYPTGWKTATSTTWKEGYFKVINNPYELDKEGVKQAPSGKSILKMGSSIGALSEAIDIEPGMDYFLTSYFHTLNLQSGSARIVIRQESSNGERIRDEIELVPPGSNWKLISHKFTSAQNVNKIRILIDAVNGSGNFYVDNIAIAPQLQIANGLSREQSCRLYPENKSQSCDYFDDSGIRRKGLTGYCMQYDQAPGDPSACLQWWPVDRVKGDIEEGFGGYSGKFPLYYCSNLNANFKFVEMRKGGQIQKISKSSNGFGFIYWGSVFGRTASGEPDPGLCPVENGYHIRTKEKKTSIRIYCEPNSEDLVVGDYYEYNGSLSAFTGQPFKWDESADGGGVMIYDVDSGKIINPEEYFLSCGNVYQTVNSFGSNKAWTSRTSPGSTYVMPQIGIDYDAKASPFGAASVPRPTNNPYEWDGLSGDAYLGQQPLVTGRDITAGNAGVPYGCSGDVCKNIGFCSLSKTLCVNFDVDDAYDDVTGQHECDADNSTQCYSPWVQNFMGCPAGEVCETRNGIYASLTATTSYDRLDDIFAKSYDKWRWRITPATCANDATVECTEGENQCPGGTCLGTCTLLDGNGGNLSNTGDAELEDEPVDVFSNCNNIGNAGECGNFTYHGRTVDFNDVATLNAANSCRLFSEVFTDVADCITQNDQCDAECVDRCNYQMTGDYRVCPETMADCTNDPNICTVNQICMGDTCNGGANDGDNCTAQQVCVGSTCLATSTIVGRYVPDESAVMPSWDVPTQACPESGRPNSSGRDGYCAIAPILSNVKVSQYGNDIEIRTSGFVELTFTSDVNEEQMPLTSYTVEWGDGQTSTVAGVEIYDQPDTTNPHLLYHVYDYWNLRANDQRDDSIVCENEICTVKPRVRIKDNWGWCNGGESDNPCPLDAWEESIGVVRVLEK